MLVYTYSILQLGPYIYCILDRSTKLSRVAVMRAMNIQADYLAADMPYYLYQKEAQNTLRMCGVQKVPYFF